MKPFAGIVLRSCIALACCVALGMVFYGWHILQSTNHAFAFVMYGIMGSVFFFALRYTNRTTALALLFAMFIIQGGLVTRSLTNSFILRDIVFITTLGIAIYLFWANYYSRRSGIVFLHPVVLGALLAALNLLGMTLLRYIERIAPDSNLPEFLFWIFPVVSADFLIGFGIGLGIVAGDYLESHHILKTYHAHA